MQFMRSRRPLVLLLISLALGGCSFQLPWMTSTPGGDNISANVANRANVASKQTASPPRVAAAESNGPYRLDSGDRVRVVVSGQDALSNSYEVDGNGTIEIPSIGTVPARGLNTIQLSGAIARRLRQSNVREAHVAVQVETYRPFTIRGEVANPGEYPYVNNMTTETAISIAGGLKQRTDKSAVTVSNSQGEATRVPPPLSSPVQPGDTVIVTEDR
jgi:polysaccharide export outer membrane protein